MQVCKPTQCGLNVKLNGRDVDLKKRAVNLQRLPLGHIVFRMQELLVLSENLFADKNQYIKLSRSFSFFNCMCTPNLPCRSFSPESLRTLFCALSADPEE